MTRWRTALRVAVGLVLVAAWLAWWSPAIILMLGRLAASRLRFEVVIRLGRALVAVGLPAIASKLYSVEIWRAERRMRVLTGRRG